MAKSTPPTCLKIHGEEFVVLRKAEYLRLVPAAPMLEDARKVVRGNLGASLLEARKKAGLSQAALAKKLRVTQSMVSQAESGHVRIGERYVAKVLKACGLPKDW
jgi:ribosome-binding protein aMBF1 (putative translation factor)